MPKYEWVGELGAGRKGEIKLMRNQKTKELVAVKYIARQVCLAYTAFAEHLIGILTRAFSASQSALSCGVLFMLCCAVLVVCKVGFGYRRVWVLMSTQSVKLSITGSCCIPTSSGIAQDL